MEGKRLDGETKTLAPLRVGSAAEVDWHREADVLVVGFGGAGAATALRAAQLGLSALVVDRNQGGGATLASGGVVYAGGGTRVQQQTGERDTPEQMFNYLKMETQGIVQDATLKRFCQQSAANLDWLMAQGVPFSGPVWKQKTSYPNAQYFLYHPDNSLLPDYAKRAKPAARGHRGVMKKGRSATDLGGALYWPLRKQCARQGVATLLETEVRQLVVDAKGRVLGARALRFPPGSADAAKCQRRLRWGGRIKSLWPFFLPGAKWLHKQAGRLLAGAEALKEQKREWVNLRARKAVCLASGGFIFNRAMVKRHCPAFLAGMPLGTEGDDGSGIRLGQSAGGALAHMGSATAWRFINPPAAWTQGLVVNAKGARFVNECCYGATLGDALVHKAGGKAWLLLDAALVRQAWRQIWPTKVLSFQWQLAALNMLFAKPKFRTLEALCARYGFDQRTLAKTLAQAASAAKGEAPDPFGRPPEDSRALAWPLHVIDISLDARWLPCTVMTMGGLQVDEATGQALSKAGKPIPGLYAAGRTAVGIPSRLYVSGLSLADCIFSALRAATHIAKQSKR